jgi:hypothetical protein
MNINVNVVKKFKVNNAEYNSLEEMPPDVRETFQKLMSVQGRTPAQVIRTSKTKIDFNGVEYNSVDEMPPEVRQMYEQVMKTVGRGLAQSDFKLTAGIDTTDESVPGHQRNRNTTEYQVTFRKPSLIMTTLVVVLVLVLYYILRGK